MLNPSPRVKTVNQSTEPGELTHIDLWGKYAVKSINGNQYYLLFVDDAKHYITISFLKEKLEVAQAVINYTQLLVQGQKLKGIQIGCGNEFVNDKLQNSCKECGIHIHLTALYSPSQNGIVYEPNTCRTCACNAHCKRSSRIPLRICSLTCGIHMESIIHETPADFNTLSGVV